MKQNYPEWRRRGRRSRTGFPYPASVTSALEVYRRRSARPPTRARGSRAASCSVGTFKDLLISEEANETAADFVRTKISEIVHDPAVAEMLMPRTFPFGTKRLPLDTNYYETFNRANVTLVDLRATPIQEITETGIRTTAGEYDLDVIVYATGFDAMTGPLFALDIQGRDGKALADTWAEGPRDLSRAGGAGFPNLFTITGPGQPVGAEQHAGVDRAARGVDQRLPGLPPRAQHGRRSRPAGRDGGAWTEHVQEVASLTLYPKAASWYMGANIPGKPRCSCPTSAASAYRDKCDEVAANGYEGFDLARTQPRQKRGGRWRSTTRRPAA